METSFGCVIVIVIPNGHLKNGTKIQRFARCMVLGCVWIESKRANTCFAKCRFSTCASQRAGNPRDCLKSSGHKDASRDRRSLVHASGGWQGFLAQ